MYTFLFFDIHLGIRVSVCLKRIQPLQSTNYVSVFIYFLTFWMKLLSIKK